LNSEAAAIAVIKPAEHQHSSWSRQAVDVVVEASAGYPYFSQEFAKASWDYSRPDDRGR